MPTTMMINEEGHEIKIIEIKIKKSPQIKTKDGPSSFSGTAPSRASGLGGDVGSARTVCVMMEMAPKAHATDGAEREPSTLGQGALFF